MFKFEKLVFGDTGWGDEFLIATLMTLLVSVMSMGLGLFIAILNFLSLLYSFLFLKKPLHLVCFPRLNFS